MLLCFYFKGYLRIVWTDHDAYKWILDQMHTSAKQVPWALQLLKFELNEFNSPAKENEVEDSLSRLKNIEDDHTAIIDEISLLCIAAYFFARKVASVMYMNGKDVMDIAKWLG